MKMREPHIVPLSRQAIVVLKELLPLTGQWKYVFPNQHKPVGHMSENTMLYALYRMGYHLRATGHGFRSTASTVLNEHGFPPDVIERQLAHRERNSVRAAYNQRVAYRVEHTRLRLADDAATACHSRAHRAWTQAKKDLADRRSELNEAAIVARDAEITAQEREVHEKKEAARAATAGTQQRGSDGRWVSRRRAPLSG